MRRRPRITKLPPNLETLVAELEPAIRKIAATQFWLRLDVLYFDAANSPEDYPKEDLSNLISHHLDEFHWAAAEILRMADKDDALKAMLFRAIAETQSTALHRSEAQGPLEIGDLLAWLRGFPVAA